MPGRRASAGQLVGTLAYMSPVQVLADPLELDTRSDVYSLGVILYRVLGRRLPYNTQGQLHQAVLATVNRAYRGDIEAIVGKALENDKARRYSSPAALTADIRRYLADEPIAARPPSTGYQLRKFARRHRALVAGVAAVFVVLVGGIVASTWEAVQADRAGRAALRERDRASAEEQAAGKERDRAFERRAGSDKRAEQGAGRAVTEKQRADDEAATAKAVSDFLQGDLLAQASANTQAGPNTKPDPDLKVRTALDQAAARIAGKFARQPLVEAAVRQTIGNTYKDLGLNPEAQGQLEAARALRAKAQGEEHPDTLSVMENLPEVSFAEGQYVQAEALQAEVFENRRRVLGEEHPYTLIIMNDFGANYKEGKYAQAEALYAKALEIQRRVLGEEHLNTLTSTKNLALAYSRAGKYAQVEALYAKVLETERRVLGEENPNTLSTMHNLAAIYSRGANMRKPRRSIPRY